MRHCGKVYHQLRRLCLRTLSVFVCIMGIKQHCLFNISVFNFSVCDISCYATGDRGGRTVFDYLRGIVQCALIAFSVKSKRTFLHQLFDSACHAIRCYFRAVSVCNKLRNIATVRVRLRNFHGPHIALSVRLHIALIKKILILRFSGKVLLRCAGALDVLIFSQFRHRCLRFCLLLFLLFGFCLRCLFFNALLRQHRRRRIVDILL